MKLNVENRTLCEVESKINQTVIVVTSLCYSSGCVIGVYDVIIHTCSYYSIFMYI